MILLQRKIDYALLLLCYLRHHPEGACARLLADRFDLGRPFVAKILKVLCRTHFVSSQRGIKGGYILVAGAERRSLANLMDAFDDPLFFTECNRDAADVCCTLSEWCPIKGPLAEVHRRLHEVLAQVTLTELFEPSATITGLQLDTSRCERTTTTGVV